MNGHERQNKGATDVWLTPLQIVRAFGDFDLDPCGELHHKTADYIFTERGLEKAWHGKVWLNPPYSEVGKWLKKLADHADSGGCGIALVFARVDTKWFHEISPRATGIFFPKGRLRFLTRDGKPAPGNAGAASMFLDFRCEPKWDHIMEGFAP